MIVIYTGPSLSIEKAKTILDATYRPPISRGDLKRDVKKGVTMVGIIDGIFFTDTPLAHKEVLAVLKKGVKVVGGSSMGALRASELDVFGMVGVGKVYECYKTGTITADDEVAVTFNPETLEQMSEPLVNIRYQLKKAEQDGVITHAERDGIIRTAASIYYPERRYTPILRRTVEEGILSDEKSASLMEYIQIKPVNLKEEDAIKTLEEIKRSASLK